MAGTYVCIRAELAFVFFLLFCIHKKRHKKVLKYDLYFIKYKMSATVNNMHNKFIFHQSSCLARTNCSEKFAAVPPEKLPEISF